MRQKSAAKEKSQLRQSLQPGLHGSYILGVWVFNNPSTPNKLFQDIPGESHINYLLFFFFGLMQINENIS